MELSEIRDLIDDVNRSRPRVKPGGTLRYAKPKRPRCRMACGGSAVAAPRLGCATAVRGIHAEAADQIVGGDHLPDDLPGHFASGMSRRALDDIQANAPVLDGSPERKRRSLLAGGKLPVDNELPAFARRCV